MHEHRIFNTERFGEASCSSSLGSFVLGPEIWTGTGEWTLSHGANDPEDQVDVNLTVGFYKNTVRSVLL
jgi:hypothetical protein